MSYERLATFERQTPFDDVEQAGGEWEELFVAFVKLLPLTGREQLENAQTLATNSHRVWTHYKDGLQPKDRMRVGEREFQIDSVINVREQNRELELLVTERV